VSQYSTAAKTIRRFTEKYLPEGFCVADIYWRPFDSMMGEAGWAIIIEEMAEKKLHGINMGKPFPTKLQVRQACQLAERQFEEKEDRRILPSPETGLLVPARTLPRNLARPGGSSLPKKIRL
jgi:hypothetical protein